MFHYLLLTTCIYVLVNLIIGLWKTKADNFESFISYRNKSSTIFILLSINATFIGGGMFFAVGQMGYEGGILPLIVAISTSLGLLGFMLIAIKIRAFCDQHNCLTLYDYIDERLKDDIRWGPRFTSLIVGINIFLYFFLLAGQFLALSFFIDFFTDLNQKQALAISVFIIFINTTIYGIIGGLKKDIITDAFQMIIIFIGMIVVSIKLFSGDVLSTLITTSWISNTKSFGYTFIIGSLLFFTPSFLVRYDLWQRALSSKNNKSIRNAVIVSIPIIVLSYALFIFVGIYARTLNTVDSEFASIYTLKSILSPYLFIIVSLSLFAAVMSSADTFLNITSISIHRILVGKINPNNSNMNLFMVRILTLIISLASIVIVLLSPDIVNLMVGAFSSLVITTPAVIYVLLNQNPNSKLAFFSVFIGFLLFLFLFFIIQNLQKTAFVYATITSIIVLLIGQGILYVYKERSKN